MKKKTETESSKYYIRKGFYKNGKRRIVILDKNIGKSKALPKPEKMWEILATLKIPKNNKENKSKNS